MLKPPEILNCCRKAGSKVSMRTDHSYHWEAAVPRLVRGQGERYPEILTPTLSSSYAGRRKEQAFWEEQA